MSALASCKRIRQPPEKLLTGLLRSINLNPRPNMSDWARD